MGQDLEGENINIYFGDANWDLPSVNIIVEKALDQDADILITLSAAVTQVAVNTVLDMDDPPVILFSWVSDPYRAGIAEDSCIKPGFVTGSVNAMDYSFIFSKLRLQMPDIQTIGAVYASNNASGISEMESITAEAESAGINLVTAAVTAISDLRPAVNSLIEKGVEALVLPSDHIVSNGMPIIVTIATDNQIPVFNAHISNIFDGITVSGGFYQYYAQGYNVGRVLTAYLNGEIDIATTAIYAQGGNKLGLNLDAAGQLGLEVVAELLEQADMIVQNSRPAFPSQELLQMVLEERRKACIAQTN